MPLLKESNAEAVAETAVVLDLGDLRKQADQLKARAKGEADAIVAEGRAEARRLTDNAAAAGHAEGFEKGRAEGFEQGRADGHAEALAQAAERLAQVEASWTEAMAQWEAQRRQMLLDARQAVMELALAIAAKVVKRQVEVDPSVVVDQLAAAIEHVARPADLTVRICPADRALIDEALPKLMAEHEQAEHIHVVDDETITAGGCVVGYGRGRIDATLETQMQRIVEQLLPTSAPSDQPESGREE